VLELQPLRRDHARHLIAFERANREYFAASISDRGDKFFEDFDQLHEVMLAEQEAGAGAFYLVVADDGAIMGRFNLYVVGGGTANLGYRVGQRFAGQGLATTAVDELCRLASARHDLGRIRAATSHENIASQKVLLKTGFLATGPADPSEIGGHSGFWYQRDMDERS
jgi:[ribosomal protein S5]-alanine N-acetyltransferase